MLASYISATEIARRCGQEAAMDFVEEVRQFSTRAQQIAAMLQTEEATKLQLVVPFLQLLGYNVFDPSEVVPEFTADVGLKKGEKVDYAILKDGRPVILIEVKPVSDDLTGRESQLYRYFTATSAKFGILTNGRVYKFYSDLKEPNKMDEEPFLQFDLLDPREAIVLEVKRFHKQAFDVEDVSSIAVILKYVNRIKAIFGEQVREPSDRFVDYWLDEVYEGQKRATVRDRFRPIIKQALGQYVNDLITERLRSAMEATSSQEPQEEAPSAESEQPGDNVVTTLEELEAFLIVKAILRRHVAPDRIGYKDTKVYFSVLLDGKATRWVCRFRFRQSTKSVGLRAVDGSEERVGLRTLDQLWELEPRLVASARFVAGPKTDARAE
ncbi:MAG: endonuclease [Firmicutes bacterium]|nr:endonuclease [Bacillota bacterium]